LVGKDVIFSTEVVNTVKGGQYYLLSPENISQATVKFFDGDQVVKEIRIDLKKGLNELNLGGLPRGQFRVKVFKDGLEYPSVQLGIKGSIKAAAVMNGQLLFELSDGSMIDPSKIIYLGGV
jgi:flagellar basal-body rod modification protein FlgD